MGKVPQVASTTVSKRMVLREKNGSTILGAHDGKWEGARFDAVQSADTSLYFEIEVCSLCIPRESVHLAGVRQWRYMPAWLLICSQQPKFRHRRQRVGFRCDCQALAVTNLPCWRHKGLTGVGCSDAKFVSYGRTFGQGDVIGAKLFEGQISFAVNGSDLGRHE